QVLTQSDTYEAGQYDASSAGSEADRALARLGIFKDSLTGDLIVGGSALQDGKLYSVATTDYVGLGDTGYPAFRQVPVLPATRVRDYERLEEISALVCHDMIRGIPGRGAGGESCRAAIDVTAYFDQVRHWPYSQSVSASTLEIGRASWRE